MNIRYCHELPSAEALYELYNTMGWSENLKLTSAELFETVSRSWLTVAAYSEDRLVGAGRILSDQKIHAFITGVVVHPEYQGKGIGRGIVVRMLLKCQEHDIRNVQLFCTPDKVAFYRQFGFEKLDDYLCALRWGVT